MNPGTRVAGRFEVVELAGTGAMGAVYRARDLETGELVALKVMLSGGPNLTERFIRETQLLAELHHPSIVRYITHGAAPGGGMFLAMEWLDGIDLATRVAQGPLGIADSVELVGRVADALSVAHRRGVLHRDIKPSNLFLPGGRIDAVKVLDFGIARLGGAGRPMTRTGILVGTPGYMAPEQARGDSDLDARADVFSIGCVLYECLTGRYAFEGEHVMALLAKILLAQTPRVSEVRPEVPPAVDDLVARMLSKDREQRPADGGALADEILALGPIEEPDRPSPSAPPSVLTVGEQRLVSVVVVAGKRSREAAERDEVEIPDTWPKAVKNDAGEWADESSMITAIPFEMLAQIRTAVAPFGAGLEAMVDGTILVMLSGSGVATDLAAQAGRCALALRAVLPKSPIALATGRGELLARAGGEVIDRAASMARGPRHRPTEEGEMRGVRVDDVTAGLLDARFVVSGDANGLFLTGLRERATVPRTLLGKHTPCVGRDRELAWLEALVDESVHDSVSRVALVTGPAGIGKSRLRDEFLRRVIERHAGLEVWHARGDSLTAGAPFMLIAQALRATAGIRDGEPIDVQARKLRARVARCVPEGDQVRVTEFLGELIGLPFDASESVQLRAAREDAMLMGDQMRRAWEDFVSAECGANPVLLMLEDLHWGDLPSVKFVDSAMRNVGERPLFVVGFGRDEVHEVFPRLWADRGVQELRLSELSRKASERLVRHVLGKVIDDAQLAQMLDRAAGNAFYLEELIRAVATGTSGAMPETVLAMVQARIESLEPETRRLLRAASVFGQVFWDEGVKALLGSLRGSTGARSRFDELAEHEWIAVRVDARFTGTREYTFRHSLVREAAYAMLTPDDRGLGHRLAAQWLERAGERDARTLAEHYERGGEPLRALDAWVRAATDAMHGNDFAAVIAHGERAIACGASGETFARIRLLQAEAERWRGQSDVATRHASEAYKRFAPFTAAWYDAAGELSVEATTIGDVATLRAVGHTLLADKSPPSVPRVSAMLRSAASLHRFRDRELTEQLRAQAEDEHTRLPESHPVVSARIGRMYALDAMAGGNPQAFVEYTQTSLEQFRSIGDARNVCFLSGEIGYGLFELGLYEQAENALRETITESTRLGILNTLMVAKHNLGLVLARLGKVTEGEQMEREALDLLTDSGDPRVLGGCEAYLSVILLASGRAEEAEAAARRGVEALAVHRSCLPAALGPLIDSLLALGRADEALIVAERGAGEFKLGAGAVDSGEAHFAVAVAEAFARGGRLDDARAMITRARNLLLARAGRIDNTAWRDAFLFRVPEHARTMACFDDWCGANA